MKLISFFATAALTGMGIFALAVLFGYRAMGTFSFALIPLILIGFVRDYAPRQSRWEPGNSTAPFPVAQARQSNHSIKLAA